jgi:acetyltransferase-like isoleucine patch superfamily enzyme
MSKYHLNQREYNARMHSKSSFQIFLCKLFGLLIQIIFSNNVRTHLARAMGVKIGKNIYIGKYCLIDDTFSDLITIEDNVVISFGTTITTHDASCNEVAPVVIKRGAFIGARSIILPGVTIAESSIVGAGSVVTRDVPPGKVVGGCPAKIIQKS